LASLLAGSGNIGAFRGIRAQKIKEGCEREDRILDSSLLKLAMSHYKEYKSGMSVEKKTWSP
jgi:hypothetical protein